MDQSAVCRLALTSAVVLTSCGWVVTVASGPLTAQAPPRQAAAQRARAKAGKQGQPATAEQTIAILVNDEPITAYEIQQRTAFLAMQSSGGGPDLKTKAEARWKEIIKNPKLNDELQALIRQRNVKSQEEAQAVQKEFVVKLQKNMIDQLQRESRAAMLPKFRKEAQEELIEERLKLIDHEIGRAVHAASQRVRCRDCHHARSDEGAICMARGGAEARPDADLDQ